MIVRETMILKHAQLFVDGKFQRLDMAVLGNKITQIAPSIEGEDAVDCTDHMVIPGLLDIHTHGCIGHDWATTDAAGYREMCAFYARNGVTSLLATFVTVPYATYMEKLPALATYVEEGHGGARIEGIHLEGPYFAPAKKGAHNADDLRLPNLEEIRALLGAAKGHVRLLAIDPVQPGAVDAIRTLAAESSCTLSLAHTVATFDAAMAAFEAGATHVTHLFNAMAPLHHREPGLAGAAISHKSAAVELITDGVHVHPSFIAGLFRALSERLVIISDSLSATGLPDGKYALGNLDILIENGRATLPDGTLAGSTITLFEGLRRAVREGAPLEQAILSATAIPARAVGIDHRVGLLAPGRRADFLLLDRALNLKSVYLNGALVG
ncbi:N-acetylglucosamine-6-phosphate deacetylase [Oscillospiraceae bacterium OttesenSCG-928-F05]|nr:N-acetylglucosamine-6-phosphate deacetylase [Oscillospiraceae bacterium OttesenSCG-928-F05]